MVQGSPFRAAMERSRRRNSTIARTASQSPSVPSLSVPASEDEIQPARNPTSEPASADGGPGSDGALSPKRQRSIQLVSTISKPAHVVRWMVNKASETSSDKIASRAVKKFPNFFHGSVNANLVRASRLWKDRHKFSDAVENRTLRGQTTTITRLTNTGPHRHNLKAVPGRGRKRAMWVDALQLELRDEFDRLRRVGVKFTRPVLILLAHDILNNNPTDSYGALMIDQRTGKTVMSMVNARWIQAFCDRFNIIQRAHTGKHRMSPAQEEHIEKEVAYHLGCMKRMFDAGEVDENDVENADETHFLINMDDGKTLGFCGEKEVRYADVVSGGEGMTMFVRLSGGRDSKIEPPLMIFKNENRKHPIRGTPDNVPGVAYRTGPKGWMDTQILPQYFRESHIIKPLPNGRTRVMFVDNCSGHNETPALNDALKQARTELHYFPANCTHLIQPCDSFVIQKIKQAWSKRWEAYKMEQIRRNQWTDNSGKLFNPGGTFFLRLAVSAVRDVNNQRDAEGLRYSRKAMIQTGMALNTNGCWEETQLTPKLQQIIARHRDYFDGKSVMAEAPNPSKVVNPEGSDMEDEEE